MVETILITLGIIKILDIVYMAANGKTFAETLAEDDLDD